MTPQQRSEALHQGGATQAQIARRLGVSKSLVSQVMHGQKASARVRRALAWAMGLPVAVVFPPDRGRGRPRRKS